MIGPDSLPAAVALSQFLLFSALYALQGVVVAYFFNFNQTYLGHANPPIAAERIAWVQAAVTVPLVLKFLGGPISDRFNLLGFGHRKPYIVLGLILQSIGLFGLTRIDPARDLGAFTASALLAVIGLALYDTACDGMVIDVTPPDDRRRVQGALVASRFLATMLGSWAFGQWLEVTGNGPGRGDGVILACAALSLAPLALAWFSPEPRRAAEPERFPWEALRVFTHSHALVLIAFGVLYATVSYGVEINLSPYYDSQGFGSSAIGTFAGVRYLGRALGAVAFLLLAGRLGRRAALVLGIIALAGTTAGQIAAVGPLSAGFWGFAFGAANGWDDALFNVMCMEASDPRMAASIYALFMAVSNVSAAGGGLFGSAVVAFGAGYEPVFLASAGIALAALALVRPLSRPPQALEFVHD